jgi:murein DD-endopeptidase MepM/ murein hydrolase activator NlpD
VPATPSPAETPAATAPQVAATNAIVDPKPLKKIVYPFLGLTQRDGQQITPEIADALQYLKVWARVGDGFYPLGINGQFHGGIHFDGETAGVLAQHLGIRCIADGEVIAYRVDNQYPKTDYSTGGATFSSGFVLVRHRLQIPKNLMQAEATPVANPSPSTTEVMYFPFAIDADADWNVGMRRFGSGRSGGARSHAGCDLYSEVGRAIYAVTEGEVIEGPRAFYAGTHFLAINHGSFSILYGEIKPGSSPFSRGNRVEGGQKIAEVGRLNNYPQAMLHLEMYDNSHSGENMLLGTALPGKMLNGRPTHRREDLINPAPYLNQWKLNKPNGSN